MTCVYQLLFVVKKLDVRVNIFGCASYGAFSRINLASIRTFIKGAPRSASKLSIDPINSHASHFGKSTGSNKRSVPINRTVSSNWNQRVIEIDLFKKQGKKVC